MRVKEMIDGVRTYISEFPAKEDINEDSVYFKTDTILRVLNEAQEIIQQKLIQYDTHFLAKEAEFVVDDAMQIFIPDMFVVLLVYLTKGPGSNQELFPFDSAQRFNTTHDYEIFGNKILFRKTVRSGSKIMIRYVKRAEQLQFENQISEIPVGFHHVLIKYAASMLLGLDEAFNLAKFFDEQYDRSVKEMTNTSINRQHQEPRFVNQSKDRFLQLIW